MRRRIAAWLDAEGGFGLLEMLVSLIVMSVALFALLNVFASAEITLARSAKVGTASVIANQQMERFRALTWDEIAIDSKTSAWADAQADTHYTADEAYDAPNAALASPVGRCLDGEGNPYQWCLPIRTVDRTTNPPSPDGRVYRVDTYIGFYTPLSTTSVQPLLERRVTVVVRDASRSWLPVVARESSYFDQFTGEAPAAS